MDDGEQGQVIEDGRDEGGLGDGQVADADDVRHDEGRRAHDRGHHLPACGGHGLDRAREVGRVADLLHERDGEGAGAVDVGGGASRNGPEQSRGENGDLGGPACGLARQQAGKIHEQRTHL